MMRTIRLLVIFFMVSVALQCFNDGDTLRQRFGLFYNYQLNYHKAEFTGLPNVPSCCPKYQAGYGTGLSAGLLYELPLPYSLYIGLGIGYSVLNGKLTADEYQEIRIDNTLQKAKIEHTIDTKISSLFVEPYLAYNIFAGLDINIGGHIGYIVKNDFHQFEKLMEPADHGYFENTGTRTRNDITGKIDSLKTLYSGIWCGISYHLRLDAEASFLLVPAISYLLGMSDFFSDKPWSVNSVRLGLQVKYSPKYIEDFVKPEEELRQIIKIDTITVISDIIEKTAIKTGIVKTENKIEANPYKTITYQTSLRTDTLFKRPRPLINLEMNVPVLYLKGQFISEAFPILPIVFFGKSESKLREEYYRINDIGSFSVNSIKINPIEYQKHLLNIVGSRLTNNPDAKLSIYGFTDSTTEAGDCELALNRAVTVRNYLNQVWNIDSNRLIITHSRKCIPPEPTNTKNDSGFADNRRVELLSDYKEILAPINNQRYLEPKMMNPPVITINTAGSTSKGIKYWELKGTQGGKLIFNRSGSGFAELINDTIDTDKFKLLFTSKPIIFELKLTDSEGQSTTAQKELNVIADTVKYELQRLSLILFGVSSHQLSDKGKQDITDFLKKVQPESKLTITGYTDILGNFNQNKTISVNRAKNTADFIKKINPELDIEDIKGVASLEFPPGINSYLSPIERFLSRTVFIEVLNKIK